MGRRQTILRPMKNLPDSLSSFVRFIQLKSVRERTQEEYLSWVRRLAAHTGLACASLATQEEVLTLLHWLQQTKGYAGQYAQSGGLWFADVL